MTDIVPNDDQTPPGTPAAGDPSAPAPPVPTPAAGDDPVWVDPAPADTRPPRRRLDRIDARWLLAITAASLVLYLLRLGAPGAVLPDNHESCQKLPPVRGGTCHQLIPLDEVHYVPDARDVLTYGTDSDTRIPDGDGQSGRFVVHPPVGKWFIAAGIWLFGDQPFGWRFFGAVFGALASALAYLIARRLWAERWAAVLAAILLAVDGLWFVQSRVAMLDIYVATFFLLAVWLLLEDRDRVPLPPTGIRWWRVGGAVAIGLALATKWSIVPLVGIIVGMAFAWELSRAWRTEAEHTGTAILTFFGTFTLIPLLVYSMTFLPWAVNENRYSPGECSERGSVLTEQICYHGQMVGFHRNLEKFTSEPPPADSPDAPPTIKPNHPYFGEAWSWPWIGRPVAHHFETIGEGETQRASEVLGLPNPAIWWLAFASLLPLLYWTLRGSDIVAAFLFGIIAAGWVPYLIADLIDRPVFLFYATPIVPFLVMAVVHLWVRIMRRVPAARGALIAYGFLAVAMFAYFYPVTAAHPIPRSGATGWEAHMWFNGPISDCGKQDAVKIRCWI